MKITIENGIAKVETPYSQAFVSKIKKIGGARWDSSAKVWIVPAEFADDVREIMRKVYGEDDNSLTVNKVDVKLTFNSWVFSDNCSDVTVLGRCISRARGRDSGAQPGPGVAYLAGNPSSGGSAKNWYSVVDKGSVVMLRGVPRSLLDGAVYPDGCIAEVIEIESAPDEQSLRAEREKLLARVAEINKLLQED